MTKITWKTEFNQLPIRNVSFDWKTQNCTIQFDPKCLSKKTTNNLLIAAKVLNSLKINQRKKQKFDIEVFGYHRGMHQPSKDNYCGTAACALGWLGIKEVFPSLKAEWTYASYDNYNWHLRLKNPQTGSTDFDAAEDTFDLPSWIMDLFFSHTGYLFNPTPKDVAKRLNEFAKHQKITIHYSIFPENTSVINKIFTFIGDLTDQ